VAELLLKLFVKDYKNTQDPKVRASCGVMASIVGIVVNAMLFALKAVIGLAMSSISILADAFNNLSDAGSSVIGFIGIKLSRKPPDKEHPFGHGRSEYIAALIVAFLVLQVGLSLLKNSFNKILHPQEVGFQPLLVVFLCISVLIKLWLSIFNKKLGRTINSSVLKAASTDALNDVAVTSVTIISVIISKTTGLNIDGWIGLAVSGFVLFSGFKIAKQTLMPLLGEAVDRGVYKSITSMVESYDNILGSHDLIAHNYGPSNTMASIHVEVPNYFSIQEIHETIDRIERDVLRELGIFLVIHMDPVEVNDKSFPEKKNNVVRIVKEFEDRASIHDFRIIGENGQSKIIFDLVVPHSYSDREEEAMREAVSGRIRGLYRCDCMITIEHNFIAE